MSSILSWLWFNATVTLVICYDQVVIFSLHFCSNMRTGGPTSQTASFLLEKIVLSSFGMRMASGMMFPAITISPIPARKEQVTITLLMMSTNPPFHYQVNSGRLIHSLRHKLHVMCIISCCSAIIRSCHTIEKFAFCNVDTIDFRCLR